MKRRDLSEEERALWRRAVRDVAPARRPRSAASPVQKPKPANMGAPAPGRAKAKAPAPARGPAKKEPRAFGAGDPKRDRAAGRRRLPVEKTLDLHGLTQAEAHRRLVRFLNAASADGARLALVITGKGGRAAEGEAPRTGVLRMRFLDWIEEAPVRGLIARVSQARARDGGAGAFYVFLKRKGAGVSPRP